MDLTKVEFVRSSDLLAKESYWKTVMKVARANTVKRIIRCSQIMGRSENESLQASQILYPCMQCADIFELGADITQLGMDQRKVNMLAREVGPKLGFYKPVVISHHMLMGLGQPPKTELKGAERGIELKMSKSKPDTAIFMTDSREEVFRKFKKAYCPEGIEKDNPVLEYAKYIVFERFDKIVIRRDEKFGGNLEVGNYEELRGLYLEKKIHPLDLKSAIAEDMEKLLEPVRIHFEKNKRAKELLKKVKNFEVTR
jgi:tyrosyl-tRNA synthetase